MQNSARCVLPGDIDEQMAKHAVDEPGRDGTFFGDLPESDLQFIKAVVAGFIHARAWLVGPRNRPENRYESDG